MMITTLEEYSDYLFDRKAENERISKACDLLARSDKNIDKVIADTSLSPREYIEVIALRRKEGYSKSTGNGIAAAEQQIDLMYMNTPWKFVEEFLQNADDCRYEGIPKIEIIVDENKSTVEFIYNERGFSRGDVWALTAFSQSTKSDEQDSVLSGVDEDGIFYKERTGRKGIGFKSVFSLAADNVCIHVRSNEFSFKLDNAIGRVMPVWEDDLRNDGFTHVIVELINPKFPLKSIFPEFKKLFCISDPGSFFQKSPILFMHRLQDITVSHISGKGDTESFSVILEYSKERTEYCDSFDPKDPVLAGVRHKGHYYRKYYGYLDIYLMTPQGEDTIISCVRETQMVLLDGKYRNVSIISPILQSDSELKWSKGSLFRTFPMMDHEFQLPFAIDAPYELNSARKGIEYNNIGTARQLNTDINSILFSKEGVLADFVMHLRAIPDIRMDFYMSKGTVILFNNDTNRDGSRRLIPEVDLMAILRKLPVYRLYFGNEYASLDSIVSVEPDLFSWLGSDRLLELFFGKRDKNLASIIYSDSSLLRNQGIIDGEFADVMNDYLDYIDQTYTVGSQEYIDFYNQKLFPFLKRQYGSLIRNKSYEKLRVFLSRVRCADGEKIVRESYQQGKWFIYSGKNNLSFAQYRIADSSPVDLRPVFQILKDFAKIRKLDDEFASDKINNSAAVYEDWSDIKLFLEAALYYGFTVDGLRIAALRKYAVCESYDNNYNPFRDAGVVKSISAQDIEELVEFYGNTSDVVLSLKEMGLRSGTSFGKSNGSIINLDEDSLQLLNSENEAIVLSFLRRVYDHVLKVDKKIMLSYENIAVASVGVKLALMHRSKMIVTDAYAGICESILANAEFWKEESDIFSELLIRARVGAKKNTIPNKKRTVNISLQYVLEHKLGEIVRKALEDRHFEQIRLINNEYFSEIPSDEVRSIIGVLVPEKLESQMKAGEVRYFCGDLSTMPSNHRYLLDGSGKVVFLHSDDNGDYKDALAKYLNTSFDPEALALIADLEEQNRYVKEKWIIPALEVSGHNLKEAFQILEMDFANMSPKEYIQILSWFRFQSYSEEVGNAASNSENEIESDYKEQPWHFVYEFLQNVDDCQYPADITTPSLNIEISEVGNSITFIYNEVGFSADDINAITKFGDSNKSGSLDSNIPETGIFDLEKTGRMGRGFKSVFALPGKDIVVHIQSNGYSFKFLKRLGQIIPVWEETDNNQCQGTRITVEGFNKKDLPQIYTKLREMFCIDNIDEFFAGCPVLYLRKLKSVSIAKGNEKFSVEIHGEICRYSENTLDVGNRRIVSGIRHDSQFCEYVWEDLHISICNGDIAYTSLDAVRYTKMLLNEVETRIISITSPIITDITPVGFRKGGLFRTLPLGNNKLGLPFAVNAPFRTDDGRTQVRDQKRSQNLIDEIFDNFIPELYKYIRSVQGIIIEKYIAPYNDAVFEGYQNIRKINLGDYSRKQPILKLHGREEYISFKNAKILPRECYDWPDPAQVAHIFCPETEESLVEKSYANSRLNISQINLVDSLFVNHINEYLDYVESQKTVDIWSLIDNHVIPLITSNYLDLRTIYFKEKTVEDLKALRVFAFTSYDGSYIRESAKETTIWLSDCPEVYAAYGNYRSLNRSPIHYTEECCKWMSELHELVSYSEAFSKDAFAPTGISDWYHAKQLIETILYYRVSTKFKVPYLRKCVLSEQFENETNIFRDAYLELQNNNIISHYIDEEDIIDIWTTVGEVSEVDPEDIVRIIMQLGVRTGRDFFYFSQDSIRCNDETLQLLQDYCTTKEKSRYVLRLISEELHRLRGGKGDERRFIIDYKSVKDCSPILLGCLIQGDLMEKSDIRLLADKLYNDNTKYGVSNDDLKEALLYCAQILPPEQLRINRRISLKLSEIISRKLGMCVQKVVATHQTGLEFTIEMDVSCGEYSGERISKALTWLSDTEDAQNTISKTYKYYTAELDHAFDVNIQKKQMYICDGEKVILNREAEDGSLLSFVRAHYQGKDDDFSTLIDIISRQEELKNWSDTKKKQQYVGKLATFRRTTGKITSVLYPRMVETINNANGKTVAYIVPELLQNINDCPFADDNQIRTLHIEIDTNYGVMRLVYDEAGFDYANVYSITALGQSSKHDRSEGEKGLGFKKVFVLFDNVEIYSNGFYFTIQSKEPTVPTWISDSNKQKQNENVNGTCMIFHTNNTRELKKLAEMWVELFKNPYAGSVVSPLFLENISSYSLVINGTQTYSVSRSEILQDYYVQKRKLINTYERLNAGSIQELDKIAIRSDLKSRTKCAVMSETEFDEYLKELTISVCIPRNASKKVEGVFFSTLPTTSKTELSMFINLPFELTTGRDEILEDSVYNQRIMNMVFGCSGNRKSVFGDILEQAAIDLPDKEIFEYINDNIAGWINLVSNTEQEKESHKRELERLALFHAYPNGELVSIGQSYSIDRIMYQYLQASDDITYDVEKWLHQHTVRSVGYRMIKVSKSPIKSSEALEKFVRDIGIAEGRFPLLDKEKDLVVEYFRDEYGALEVDEDE